MFWLAGGFQGRSWLHLQVMLPWVVCGIVGALLCARVVALLALDDAVAAGMGVRVALLRPRGAAWAVALNAAAGGLLLVTADAAARILAAPREIPVGVMTAVLGAPVVIYVVRRVRPEVQV